MAVKVNFVQAKTENETKNMCHGCSVYCCELIVELTVYDILRIMILENKKIDDFVSAHYADPDALYSFRADGIFNQLTLRHINGACVFFKKEENLKCSIDKSKPAHCLAYPFSFRTGKLRNDVLCPKENLAKTSRVKMSPEVLAYCRWEEERYLEMVDDWNLLSDGSESIEQFLRFAVSEMELEKTFVGRHLRKVKRSLLHLQKKVVPVTQKMP
jgi:Fe-S-cluster containining protein